MEATLKNKDIEQLLAEADELIRRIDSDAVRDMEEEHRIQLEKHAQNLKKLRSEARGKTAKEGSPENSSYGEGMHEAIMDIITAMKSWKINHS